MKKATSERFAGTGVRVQIDRSGVGHAWQDIRLADVRPDVIEALVDESGRLVVGAEATVGGQPYRVIAA